MREHSDCVCALADALTRTARLGAEGARVSIGPLVTAMLHEARATLQRGGREITDDWTDLYRGLRLRDVPEGGCAHWMMPRIAMYDGLPRICTLLADPGKLSLLEKREYRLAHSDLQGPLTENNSCRIAFKRSNFLRVERKGLVEYVDGQARETWPLDSPGGALRLFQVPVSVVLVERQEEVHLSAAVPFPLRVAKTPLGTIYRNTKFKSCQHMASERMLTEVGLLQSERQEPKDSLAGSVELRVLLNTMRRRGDRLSLDDAMFGVAQMCVHPFRELGAVSDKELEREDAGAEALYLLARVSRYAHRAGETGLTASALIQALCGDARKFARVLQRASDLSVVKQHILDATGDGASTDTDRAGRGAAVVERVCERLAFADEAAREPLAKALVLLAWADLRRETPTLPPAEEYGLVEAP